MNGPRRVQPAGVGCRQAHVRPRVRALPRARGRTPLGPRAGGTVCSPPTQRALPARRQAPVAGRVPLPATGAYVARSEGSRGLSNPTGIHLSFALGLSNEVGPPQHIEVGATGELVAVDTFYAGTLKGVGKVYIQTRAGLLQPRRLAPALHLEDAGDRR